MKPTFTMSLPRLRAAVSVKLVLVAACALIDPDGRVLLAQRPAGKSMAGLWEFPGGKVEPGERPEITLIRELKEELGIVVKEECLAPLTFASHLYPDFHLLMPLYVCRRWDGIVQAPGGAEAQMGAAQRAAQLSDAARRRAVDPAPDDAAVKRTRGRTVMFKSCKDAAARRFVLATKAAPPRSNMRSSRPASRSCRCRRLAWAPASKGSIPASPRR